MKKPKFKLIVQNGDNEYENQKVSLLEDVNKSNIKMIDVLKRMGINLVNFISLGNSIATGYSMSDIVKPLFKRNENLEELLKLNEIDSNFYNFCRAQKNKDSKVLEWILKGYTASRINTEIRNSLRWNKDVIDENEYPIDSDNDITFNQINMNPDESTSNIVVYNGGTGTFLDAISRKGLSKVFGSFKKDRTDMESVLQEIYSNSPNTQVYVCGIPQLLGLGFATKFLLNRKIKKICEKYPNAVYVDPTPVHLLYKNREGKFTMDFHPNQIEYLKLTNNIINSIANNYMKTAFCTEAFEKLKMSNVDINLKNDLNYVINNVLPTIIEKYNYLFDNKEQMIDAYNKFIKLFITRNLKDNNSFNKINESPDKPISNITIYSDESENFIVSTPTEVLGSFKKDFASMEKILQNIYIKNPNTQVCVHGIVSEKKSIKNFFLNRKIKKLCEKYPNTIYIKPGQSEYNSSNSYQNINITSPSSNDSMKIAFCTEAFEALAKMSDEAQYVDVTLRDNVDYAINTTLLPIIEKYRKEFENERQFLDAIDKIKKLFKLTYPHDFFFVPKKETISELNNYKRLVKDKKAA